MYQYFLAPIIGYLLGSIPFAWLIVKIVTGKDVREEGAGSVSTRNTVRTAGYPWAILTGILDNGKGFLADLLQKDEEGVKALFGESVSTKEGVQNSGYGCYLAREISRRCGWQLDATNRNDGGACFSIKAPLG